MSLLDSETAAGRCPDHLVSGFRDFYTNYRNAVVASGVPGFTEEVASQVQATILENVLLQLVQPFDFQPYHHAVLEPYSYFDFGQWYTGPLFDFHNSLVGHNQRLDRVESLLAAGHNVILLANHQTEVDPAVWSHLLAKSHPKLAQDVIYVAGDRVVTDAIFKVHCLHGGMHGCNVCVDAATSWCCECKHVRMRIRRVSNGQA